MAGPNQGQGQTSWLYFIVGALVVVVGVLAYLYFHQQSSTHEVKIQLPKVESK